MDMGIKIESEIKTEATQDTSDPGSRLESSKADSDIYQRTGEEKDFRVMHVKERSERSLEKYRQWQQDRYKNKIG